MKNNTQIKRKCLQITYPTKGLKSRIQKELPKLSLKNGQVTSVTYFTMEDNMNRK